MQGPDSNTFAYDSLFIRVNPRKKRKRNGKRYATTPCDLLTRVREELETDRGDWSLSCKEIFCKALDEARIKPRKVLCFGLGSPSLSRDARAQLVFLDCLCASLDIDSADVSMYDPVFTDADRELLQTLGMRCLDHTQASDFISGSNFKLKQGLQGAQHSLDCPTILYMPHCDLKLYEMVICANWTLEGLCNIVFFANRFSDYVDNNSASKLEKESPCLMRLGMWIGHGPTRNVHSSHDDFGALVPFVESRPLPTSDVFPSAFNNLSVQYVSRTPLSLRGDAFWENLPLSSWNV